MPRSNHSPYGCRRGDLALDLAVVDDPALLGVDEEHVARLQAALADDVLGRHRRSRRSPTPSTTQPSLGLEPAAGAQAVAVERRADHAAVGERDRRRAVPRLHQARRGTRRSRAGPRACPSGPPRPPGSSSSPRAAALRPASVSSSSTLSNVGRVEPPGRDDRAGPSRSSPNSSTRAATLARAHPVAVAAQRVDLAVVGDHPERLRQLPGRERVGREARVDERERGLRCRGRCRSG